jgi:hypothetical protein
MSTVGPAIVRVGRLHSRIVKAIGRAAITVWEDQPEFNIRVIARAKAAKAGNDPASVFL